VDLVDTKQDKIKKLEINYKKKVDAIDEKKT
jgi:hypothetical protein